MKLTEIETHGHTLERCPLCRNEAGVWECADEHGVFKFVACNRGCSDEEMLAGEECVLSLPPRKGFFKSRIADAVLAWNNYALACASARVASTLAGVLNDPPPVRLWGFRYKDGPIVDVQYKTREEALDNWDENSYLGIGEVVSMALEENQ